MTGSAPHPAVRIIAGTILIVTLIAIIVGQWRLARRVDELGTALAAHQGLHAMLRERAEQKAASEAEFRARVYFPPGTFASDPERDRSLADSFGEPLRSLRLEPLWDPAHKPLMLNVYRLTWLAGPDGPRSVAIHLAGPHLTRAKSYRIRHDALGVGTPIPDIDQPVTADRVEEFERLFAEAGFWQMPPLAEDESTGAGPRSIFEGVNIMSRYHVVVRTSDGHPGYQTLCRFMRGWTELQERPSPPGPSHKP